MSHQTPINSNVTHTITTTTSKNYPLRAAEKLRDKRIHGLYVRLQNGAGDKLSKNGNALAPASIINRAYLYTKEGSTDQFQAYPLEHFGFDSQVHCPGDFAPLKFPSGFDLDSSFIQLTGTAAVAPGTDIEIVFITDPNC